MHTAAQMIPSGIKTGCNSRACGVNVTIITRIVIIVTFAFKSPSYCAVHCLTVLAKVWYYPGIPCFFQDAAEECDSTTVKQQMTYNTHKIAVTVETAPEVFESSPSMLADV